MLKQVARPRGGGNDRGDSEDSGIEGQLGPRDHTQVLLKGAAWPRRRPVPTVPSASVVTQGPDRAPDTCGQDTASGGLVLGSMPCAVVFWPRTSVALCPCCAAGRGQQHDRLRRHGRHAAAVARSRRQGRPQQDPPRHPLGQGQVNSQAVRGGLPTCSPPREACGVLKTPAGVVLMCCALSKLWTRMKPRIGLLLRACSRESAPGAHGSGAHGTETAIYRRTTTRPDPGGVCDLQGHSALPLRGRGGGVYRPAGTGRTWLDKPTPPVLSPRA